MAELVGGAEEMVQGVGPIGLPHVRQDQRPQLDGFGVGPAVLSAGHLIEASNSAASANSSIPAAAPGIFLINRSHHDVPCLLNAR